MSVNGNMYMVQTFADTMIADIRESAVIQFWFDSIHAIDIRRYRMSI